MILWDVDTQVDFMLPDGKLYVPGAEETIPAMERLVAAARAAGVVHVASADDHELTDPELSDEPDYLDTYPPHCLRGTRGAAKIAATEQADPLPLSLTPYPPGLVPGLVRDRREILLLKTTFDVFTTPNAEALLALDPDDRRPRRRNAWRHANPRSFARGRTVSRGRRPGLQERAACNARHGVHDRGDVVARL